MTQEDILRMARETATEDGSISRDDGKNIVLYAVKTTQFLKRFAALVAAAQREKVAHWMRSMGYATGHGDAIEDLLDHLGTQIAEGLLMEREACAKVCDVIDDGRKDLSADCAAAIRARGNK